MALSLARGEKRKVDVTYLAKEILKKIVIKYFDSDFLTGCSLNPPFQEIVNSIDCFQTEETDSRGIAALPKRPVRTIVN